MENPTSERLGVKIFWLWLSFAAVATVVCGLAYLLVQQDIRQSANYPQSQIAEDVTSANASLPAVGDGSYGGSGSSGLVDISTSLAPFLTTFDANGNVIESNAVLDGSTPVPPHGVFGSAQAQANGEDRFTWQPQAGVRVAAVLVYHAGNGNGNPAGATGGFFALSGRSLRDVEILESRLTTDTFFVWFVALVVMFILSIFTARAFRFNTVGREKKMDENLSDESPIVPPKIIPPIIKPVAQPLRPNIVVPPLTSPPAPVVKVTSPVVVPPVPVNVVRVPTPIMPPAQMKPASPVVPAPVPRPPAPVIPPVSPAPTLPASPFSLKPISQPIPPTQPVSFPPSLRPVPPIIPPKPISPPTPPTNNNNPQINKPL